MTSPVRTPSFRQRQEQVIALIAEEAYRLPLQDSGLWFHDDLRNNFYYASYLYACAADVPYETSLNSDLAKELASGVLLQVLSLQDRNPESATYGHWPLSLAPIPQEADPNRMTVEILGCMLALFHHQYSSSLSEPLHTAVDQALFHAYQSGYFEEPLHQYNHHVAKNTAACLIYGTIQDDVALLEKGRLRLEATLHRLRDEGMSEYSSLPWLWHWIQAFTAAWDIVRDGSVKETLSELLELLWYERALFYLQGAWVGPHSRSLPHDVPGDGNVAFDYIHFGNFTLPNQLPRVEYAGFLNYEVSKAVCKQALEQAEPLEIKRAYPGNRGGEGVLLHNYTYRTGAYALGGMWERSEEFANEQHRWDLTLPVQSGSINQAFFYHPAEGCAPSDHRHQSSVEEILLYQNTVMTLYPMSGEDGANKEQQEIIGVLPKGEWRREALALYGRVGREGEVWVAVQLLQPYEVEENSDHLVVRSRGPLNGVVMDVMSKDEVLHEGITSMDDFFTDSQARTPIYDEADRSLSYTARSGRLLCLRLDDEGSTAYVDGQKVSFDDYRRGLSVLRSTAGA
ncbi:hypothetical protein SY83_04050 [Paenibacillus swuensis]|uniref:Heparinase n=1 Tax=Paenibacillus swuensis TaxID=1178515 RepID=A0A172TEY2_9BACL|nr:hypothetical protein [Paenibacillus swuensis]ANE45609.1 hypothetical protein SY83_04050 [Paenibacillus swuensis]